MSFMKYMTTAGPYEGPHGKRIIVNLAGTSYVLEVEAAQRLVDELQHALIVASLERGCIIEFAGDRFMVLQNYGTSGRVQEYFDGKLGVIIDPFYWSFEGEHVTLVACADFFSSSPVSPSPYPSTPGTENA